jgi:hypothetical protein
MSSIQRIIYPSAAKAKSGREYVLFGKSFVLEGVSDIHRIIVHEDFSLLTEKEMGAFEAFAVKANRIALSACIARSHPYRLMRRTPSGKIDYLFEVPVHIRGHRQAYPDVYQFVPALISIPPGVSAEGLRVPETLLMYVLPADRLLDQSNLLSRLYARAGCRLKGRSRLT